MRKYIAEFVGTMILVVFGTGSVIFGGTSFGPMPIALAFGFAVIVGAYAFGAISGAHFNPAISLGMAINKRITWRDFLGYIVAQILGAFVGSGIVVSLMSALSATKSQMVMTGLGATNFQSPITIFGATWIEFILTFIFVLAIMAITAPKNELGQQFAPIAIGLTLTGLIVLGVGLTGAGLNPARSLAPAVVLAFMGSASALTNMAAYIIGPLAGGALAAVVAKYLLKTEN
ncbi:aquaporin family protein [Weissella coleopterorum]|uniref:Aquaporin family protein n=1 Tax=Weissella coleopterorum TaxID=2714949 RepID=A0A6G8AY07_9LACO|nr:aquaporin [Weissella coleopterorum]QIL49948.1 aquaporin family protein [Weissella coleopterorum]